VSPLPLQLLQNSNSLSYYVSDACLAHALETVTSALYYMGRSDRVAVYTTHCTHASVTGTIPEVIYPLHPLCNDTQEVVQDLLEGIKACGTQTWDPPRPNPTMSDVILAVAMSLKDKDIRHGRTHIALLTPTTNTLHKVSETFPELYIHQINPAVLPYSYKDEVKEDVCEGQCCKNVFISNMTHYRSLPSRIKQIIRYARSQKSFGDMTNVRVEVDPKEGCELLEFQGTGDVGNMRLGQVHSVFVLIRATRSDTQEIDLDTADPLLKSSLDAYDLRQDLRNAKAVGATNAHLLSVRVTYQNSLYPSNHWTTTESQLVLTKDLGSLALSSDMSLELYRRQLFHYFSRLHVDAAEAEIYPLALSTPDKFKELRKLLERMAVEISWQRATHNYEAQARQKIPSCIGPVCVANPHDWLMEKWAAKKNMHQDMVAM
jgi:hypothetical protein